MAECEHIASGQFPAPGVPGATFVPGVEEVPEGYEVSWENNRNLPNPDPVRLLHGKSAYQLAVEAGYEGTEVEFAAEMADAAVAKAKAEAAAEAAGKSEANAAGSASAAAQSEKNAKDSEEAAQQAAGEAEQLAQAAAGSAGSASLSERNAAASEQAAEDAAEEAENRAAAAGNAAGAAALSESNAKTSEENAARSEEEAKKAAQDAQGVILSGPAEPGQLLLVKAVDENGKPTEWETVDRTHYKGEAVLESFVPEATVTVSEGMGFGIDISSAKVGETYIVNWDATEHECVCKLAAYNGMTVIAIGNVALFGGAENTGEPFVLGYIPALGMSGAFSITDGSHTVSAKKKTIPVTTLPNEYVSGLVLEKSIGTVNVLAETTFEGDRYDFIAPDFSLIEGEKYTVVFDETAYECTAYKLAIDASHVYVMLGNSSLLYNLGNSSSEPFLISYLLRTSELAFAAETSASHTLSVNRTTEVYERLPKECMPEEYTMETPFFDLVAMGLPEIEVGEQVELRVDDAEPLQALRLALMRGQVKVRFMFNPTGDYPRSVTTVVSGVYGDGMQTHFSTMIRCWGWDIGFHAVTVGVGDVQIWAKAYSLAT